MVKEVEDKKSAGRDDKSVHMHPHCLTTTSSKVCVISSLSPVKTVMVNGENFTGLQQGVNPLFLASRYRFMASV